MLQVYCQTYYEAAIKKLHEFDISAMDDLTAAEKILKKVRMVKLNKNTSFELLL